MDLYIQVALIVAFIIGIGSLVYMSASIIGISNDTAETLDVAKDNHAASGYMTAKSMLVEIATLENWIEQKAINQNVYLFYYNSSGNKISDITFPEHYYEEENIAMDITVASNGVGYDIKNYGAFLGTTKTAMWYKPSPRMTTFLKTYMKSVRANSSRPVVVVYTFNDPLNENMVSYVVTIQ